MPNINIIIFFFQLQAELREYRPTVDGNLETSALGLTFRVTKQHLMKAWLPDGYSQIF